MDKTAIRNFAIEARKILIKSAIAEAGFYGISKDGVKAPIQRGKDFEVYETLAGTEKRIFGDDINRRENLVNAVKELGFEQVIEETAYTWFNRIIAIRFMEVNNYLPTRVRVLSSETGSSTPDIVTQADTVELNMSADELERVHQAKQDNKYDEAFRLLFIKQCNELNAILPGLFEKTNDYMELLLKLPYTGDGVIRMLIDTVPEDNFNVETEGQVEIIGWMYQFYNTELKKQIESQKERVSKTQVPAKTQLFTPDWIVRYMVENSLGRVWIKHLTCLDAQKEESEIAKEFGWQFYVPQSEQAAEVEQQLFEVNKTYRDFTPRDIKCIDPCMGSGHILVYIFDLLMDIYQSEGFSEREAVFEILENNIHGIDLDRRAYQLTYFAMMMKARGYNRIFFRGKENIDGQRCMISPNVHSVEESNSIEKRHLKFFGTDMSEIERNNALNQLEGVLSDFKDAKEYGSILCIEKYDFDLLRRFVNNCNLEGQLNLEMIGIEHTQKRINDILNLAEMLSEKYTVVITNPPYMGMNYGSQKLNDYVKDYYPNSKSDLFAVFIERGINMTKINGFLSMITMQSWMFLSSYRKMRDDLQNVDVENLVHLGAHAFEELAGEVVQTVAFVFRNSSISDFVSTCDRLVEFENTSEKSKAFLLGNNRFYSKKNNFEKIPSKPYAYWISSKVLESFGNNNLASLAEIVSGMTTGNNDLYLRSWAEVDFSSISMGVNDMSLVDLKKTNWIPYHKGGEQRKWYGNIEYVVNWGQSKNFNRAKTTMTHVYLKPCITWSDISGTSFAGRYCSGGFLFDVKGSCAFGNIADLKQLIAIFNSKVTPLYIEALNPTTTTQVGDLKRIPYIKASSMLAQEIENIVNESIEISKNEWDDFEFSWDFEMHPYLKIYRNALFDSSEISLEKCFSIWKKCCDSRKERLRENEECLNRKVIELYGLADEIDPSVEYADVNLREADEYREIVSLMSYAVGCMFGRYSLDKSGLCYAGGAWNEGLYSSFLPDKDGIIPVTDEGYFDDDIVQRTYEFIKVAFGDKYFAENMAYIARVLGNKGKNEKESIRLFYMNTFYKEHCATYSVTNGGKRPIYWMFSSGDDNGFKALIYIHRYKADTVGMLRSDYLVKAQAAIENALRNAEYIISTASSAVDKAQATRNKDRYIKQLSEIRSYYPALSHVALQRIEMDLNKGVKNNYLRFQGIEISSEGSKKQTIDLLESI